MTEDRANPLAGRRRLVALAALIAVMAAAFWFVVLRDDAPDAFDIDDAAGPLDDDGDTDVEVEGVWTVSGTAGSPSEAGFRVSEELVGVGANVAVGRTTEVSGSMVIEGSSVTDVQITVGMAGLTSDDSRRDSRMHAALDTGGFPEATFVLSEPIALGTIPASGQTADFRANGDLTVKGVTRPVTVDIEARVVEETLVVVGSTDIVFADFGVEAPTAPVVLSVADQGTVEFQLFFVRS